MTSLDPAATALRAHDIHVGLHEVDRNSALLATELESTQLIGMTAAIAAWVKGHDVIADAQALKVVAVDQLDVVGFAFDTVIGVLEELDFVRRVERVGTRITSFYETIPEDYERMYGQLGEAWAGRDPTEIEQTLINVVDDLSSGPKAVSDLPIAEDARERVMLVGREAEAIQMVDVDGRQIAYSPFFAYENPEAIAETLKTINVERVAAAFAGVRTFQGTPLSISAHGEVLSGLVAAGLMSGPSLERPDQSRELFAVAPYGLGPKELGYGRPILEKALAILAAVRMGQHFGGITTLHSPAALLHALIQPERTVAWHSSTTRQYGALQRLGIVRFVAAGSRNGIQLIDTDDNVAAVKLAMDLLGPGEAAATRGSPSLLDQALITPGHYRAQIQGIRPAKRRSGIAPDEIAAIVDAAMGWRAE